MECTWMCTKFRKATSFIVSITKCVFATCCVIEKKNKQVPNLIEVFLVSPEKEAQSQIFQFFNQDGIQEWSKWVWLELLVEVSSAGKAWGILAPLVSVTFFVHQLTACLAVMCC